MRLFLNTIAVSLLFLSIAKTQISENLYSSVAGEDFLLLKDSTVYRSGDFLAKRGVFGTRLFDLDNNKITFDQLQFARFNEKYYAGYYSELLISDETGFFDIFYKTESIGTDNRGRSIADKHYYYSHQFDGIKALKYEVVKEDITRYSDLLPTSRYNYILGEIEQGGRQGKVRTGLLIGGFAVFLVGLATFPEEDPLRPSNDQAGIGSIVVSSVGFLTMLSPLLIKNPKKRYLNAIRSFNEYADY